MRPLCLNNNATILSRTLILENIRPFSINAFYYARQKTKTEAAWDWTDSVFMALNTEDNQGRLEELRAIFDPDKHVLGADLRAFYPKDIFFNKAGQVSAKTIDSTNWEKPLIDCIMLKKFHNEALPRGCKNLNTDDRYLTVMQSSKHPVDGLPRIEATIYIFDKPSL
jgi:hypothetical protein